MTNNNPLPPEIVAKWRSEFESMKSPQAIQRDYRDQDKYWNDPVQYEWQGFLMARQSVVIDLKITTKTHPHINHGSTYGDALYDVELYIEAQGYAVSRE